MADMTARQRAMEWLEWAADNPDEITGPLNMKGLQKLEAEFAAHAESELARLVAASGMDVEGLAKELRRAWDEAPDLYGFRNVARHVAALIGQAERVKRLEAVVEAARDYCTSGADGRPPFSTRSMTKLLAALDAASKEG